MKDLINWIGLRNAQRSSLFCPLFMKIRLDKTSNKQQEKEGNQRKFFYNHNHSIKLKKLLSTSKLFFKKKKST